MKAFKIQLLDTTDFGGLATNADVASYEQEVCERIVEQYHGADVEVSCGQRDRARVIVTTRDEAGRIKCDVETARAEGEIEEVILQIARDVYDGNDFWVSEASVISDYRAQLETGKEVQS